MDLSLLLNLLFLVVILQVIQLVYTISTRK